MWCLMFTGVRGVSKAMVLGKMTRDSARQHYLESLFHFSSRAFQITEKVRP